MKHSDTAADEILPPFLLLFSVFAAVYPSLRRGAYKTLGRLEVVQQCDILKQKGVCGWCIIISHTQSADKWQKS